MEEQRKYRKLVSVICMALSLVTVLPMMLCALFAEPPAKALPLIGFVISLPLLWFAFAVMFKFIIMFGACLILRKGLDQIPF